MSEIAWAMFAVALLASHGFAFLMGCVFHALCCKNNQEPKP